MTDTDVDIEPFFHGRRRIQQQSGAVFNDAADMVRQTAVRVGNVFAAFEDDNIGGLVQPAQSCGGTRAAGDAADDTDFFRHQLIPFIPFRYFLHQPVEFLKDGLHDGGIVAVLHLRPHAMQRHPAHHAQDHRACLRQLGVQVGVRREEGPRDAFDQRAQYLFRAGEAVFVLSIFGILIKIIYV